jgi:hypothetical protein
MYTGDEATEGRKIEEGETIRRKKWGVRGETYRG